MTNMVENEIIRLYKAYIPVREICRLVGRSHPTIYSILKKNKLDLRGGKIVPPEISESIIREYDNQKSIRALARTTGFSASCITDVLKTNGRKIRQQKKWSYDDTVFSTIETEEQAYWLGFLYADGYVRKLRRKGQSEECSVRLHLKKSDWKHIEKFKLFLKTDAPVRFHNRAKHPHASITLGSKKIALDLIAHGCVPRKSLILEPPKTVPECLLKHFIRGYVDGDGWISKAKDGRIRIGLLGTEKFVNWVIDFWVKQCSIFRCKVVRKKNIYQAVVGTTEDTRKITTLLYKNASVFLDRKFKKAMLLNNKINN